MVVKGKARGGPAALAKHLERRDTNEKVSVRELRGVTSRSVEGALLEMDCMGAGAISTRTLYHAAINTAPNERLTDDQKQQAIDRLEAELGFAGQPRIVVEHEKKGREHIHVVFLRIDTDRMVAISDSHSYRRHEVVARELEQRFNHAHVQGAHIGREGQERPERTPSHAEMQQAERSGLSPKEAKEQITQLWNQADSGTAFAAALKEQGWMLAKGDGRDFVLIDPTGEPHSLARRVEGANAADVRKRMADVDPTTLPSVAEAKLTQRTLTAVPKEKREPGNTNVPAPTTKATAKGVGTPAATMSVRVETVSPLAPRPVQTKTERLTAVAKATVATENTSAQRLRETLNLKKTAPHSKLQRLYSATARATASVIGKAKKLLNSKPQQPVPLTPPPKPAPEAIKAGKSTPSRNTLPSTPARLAKVTNPVRPSAPKPEKRRMTPAELDAMLGRKQAQRHHRRGPGL